MDFFGQNLFAMIVGGVVTFVMGWVITLTQRWHGRWTHDETFGVQKFHEHPTPRIGGLAILLGCAVSLLVIKDLALVNILTPLLVGGFIPFFFGFREDVTKLVPVRDRLLATMAGAVAVMMVTGWYLNRLDIPGFDHWMTWLPLSYMVTVISVAGVTNAINIMDGFNGLASGTSIVALIFLAWLAHETHDPSLRDVSLVMVSLLIGFMGLNYPWGKIFLGDAGAYFVGFVIAWIALLLPVRNEEVSPWASLLVCLYPVTEVLYSMARRLLNRVSSGQPDNLHLHSLIKTRLIRRYFAHLSPLMRNSMVAPLIWGVSAIFSYFAVLYESRPMALMWTCLVFVVCYHITYRVLVKMPAVELGDSEGGIGN